jgi:spermidine/putrescine transport system substrate-binding protein
VPARHSHVPAWFTLFASATLLLVACQNTAIESKSPGASGSAGPESATPSVHEPNALTVLEWSQYKDPKFWTDFQTASPDAGVDFELGSSDNDILSKMETGSEADIFHVNSGWQQVYVDKGLVQEIDTSKLTNWDKVPDSFKKLGQVNGKQYFLPWDWGFTSILYTTDHVNGEIKSWDVLFDDTYAGHISMLDDGVAAVAVSAAIHGWDETKLTGDQLAIIEAEWKAQKPLNLLYWTGESTDLCPKVESDDIWVAYAPQSCYATVLYDKSQPVAYANPTEGRIASVGLYGISSRTDSYQLALKFLDDKLAMTTCTSIVVTLFSGCANQEVMTAVTDPALIKALSIDDPSVLEGTTYAPPLTQAQRDAWAAMWARVKAE